jgi:hypothetical protein
MSSVGAAHRAGVPVSSARAEASRRNGARSRGPKTPEGKARAAQNALKHGLRAQKFVVLPDEDAAEFKALETALIEELVPQGVLQSVLAQRVAAAAWRLGRADRIEAELLGYQRGRDGDLGLALIRDGNGARAFPTLLRYRGAAMAEFMRALRALKALQAGARAGAEALVPAPAAVQPATAAPAPAAALRVRPAACATNPSEPERRGNPDEPGRAGDRANPSRAPRGRDPRPASVWRLPRPLPTSAGPELRARPIEPERENGWVVAAGSNLA